jgi:predicted porin
VIGLGAFYSKGPFDFGAAFERNHAVRFANTTDDAFSIAAAYDLGTLAGSSGFRLGGVYERLRYETPTGDLKRDFWGISGTLPVGGGSVYAFWGHAGNGKGDAVDGTPIGGLTKGPDSAADQWEISYSYSLSLRTLLYAGYVRIDNKTNAGYGFNINDYTTVHGGKPTGYVFGMVHFF